jgi:hypothetical protein
VLQRSRDLAEADAENGKMLGQRDLGSDRYEIVLAPLRAVGRAVTSIVEERDGIGTHLLDALDKVGNRHAQSRLVGVPNDYDVVLLEPNGLEARCDHLTIFVGIAQRANLRG